MRVFRYGLVMLGLALAVENASGDELDDSAAAAQWLLRADEVLHELQAINVRAVEVERIALGYLRGSLSNDDALDAGRSAIDQIRADFERVSSQLDCCLSAPPVQPPDANRYMRAKADALRSLRDQTRAAVDDSEAILIAVLEHDPIALKHLYQKRIDRVLFLFTEEHRASQSNLSLLEDSHPQHALLRSTAGWSAALVTAYSYLRARSRDERADPTAASAEAEEHLVNAVAAIADGRRSTDAVLHALATGSVVDLDERQIHLAVEATGTYRESFTIHEKLVAEIAAVCRTIFNEPQWDTALVEIDPSGLQLLMKRAFDLQQQRLRLVSKMGR